MTNVGAAQSMNFWDNILGPGLLKRPEKVIALPKKLVSGRLCARIMREISPRRL
jgi:hypothetical protein